MRDVSSLATLSACSRRLRVHDGDVCPLLCQRVADALSQPAIAARHQCNRAFQIHLMRIAVPLK